MSIGARWRAIAREGAPAIFDVRRANAFGARFSKLAAKLLCNVRDDKSINKQCESKGQTKVCLA